MTLFLTASSFYSIFTQVPKTFNSTVALQVGSWSILETLPQFRIRIRTSFIARYVYTYEEFVFLTEATTVQQNDSDRTKHTD